MDPSHTQVSSPSPGGKPGNLEDEIFLKGEGLWHPGFRSFFFSFAGFGSRLFSVLLDFLSLLGIWRWSFSLAFPTQPEILSSPILPLKIYSRDFAAETLPSELSEEKP